MKTGPRVRALHAHAWMALKLIDAQASYAQTRGLKISQTARTRQPRVRVGALAPQAQNWHNFGTTLGKNGWAFDAAHRRARAHHAYAPSAPMREGHSAKNFLS